MLWKGRLHETICRCIYILLLCADLPTFCVYRMYYIYYYTNVAQLPIKRGAILKLKKEVIIYEYSACQFHCCVQRLCYHFCLLVYTACNQSFKLNL